MALSILTNSLEGLTFSVSIFFVFGLTLTLTVMNSVLMSNIHDDNRNHTSASQALVATALGCVFNHLTFLFQRTQARARSFLRFQIILDAIFIVFMIIFTILNRPSSLCTSTYPTATGKNCHMALSMFGLGFGAM
jgi:hypothetical protein